MSLGHHEVGADTGKLQELNADQQQYLNYFKAIMAEIHQEAGDLVTRWEGGDEEFRARAAEFNAAFEMTNTGMAKVIDAIDGTIDGYTNTRRHLRDLFG